MRCWSNAHSLVYNPAERRGVLNCPAGARPNPYGIVEVFKRFDMHVVTVEVWVGSMLWQVFARRSGNAWQAVKGAPG
jgi:hypothetical protein